MAEDQQTERWTMWLADNCRRLAAEEDVQCDCPVDDWRKVEVVPSQIAERLAEAGQAYIDAVRAYNAEGSKGAATRQSHTCQDLREAIRAFRSGSSTEGQAYG